jgi:3-dehydroquinate synthase
VQRIDVHLGSRSYPIYIGAGVMESGAELAAAIPARDVLLVTNTTVGPLYADKLVAALAPRRCIEVALPDGEVHKTLANVSRMLDVLIANRFARDACVVALGGGVVGDMAGFAAATYQRGVPYLQVPTTLLAQVDSSVGGKTAINHPLGKNMVGAFHQPLAVIADIATLNTLPPREYAAGLAEVVKYGAIFDEPFLAWLEANAQALRAREPGALAHAIRRSCEIKALIVAQDERESGMRALLNFGHTFGHAIESASGYGRVLHGEAVAIGMALAARLSARARRISDADASRLVSVLQKLGLDVTAPRFTPEVWLSYMGRDKKNEAGRITLILLDALGRGAIVKDTPPEDLRAFLSAT